MSVELLRAVDTVAAEFGVSYCIVGAFARDVVLGLCYGLKTGEATRDIDFGLMLQDWSQFREIRSRLLSRGEFVESMDIPHRLQFRGARDLDIVPFGAIERIPGEIAWPPEFATVMSTLGLREAQFHAIRITVADGLVTPFVSPVALTLLKLIAWSERGSAMNRKDANDIALLLTTYLRAGNEQRLYAEHADLLDEADFDLDAAGARILGRDLGAIISGPVRERIDKILDAGLSEIGGQTLLRALPLRFSVAQRLLESLRKGLVEAIPK